MKWKMTRALCVCAVGFLIYIFVFHEVIGHRVVRHVDLFIGTLAVVIVGTGLIFEPKRRTVRVLWAVAAPVASVVLGSGALELVRFVEIGHLTVGESAYDRLFTLAIIPYVLTYIWTLSLMLIVLSEINHLFVARDSGQRRIRLIAAAPKTRLVRRPSN